MSEVSKAFHLRQMTRPPLALPLFGLPFLPMFLRRMPTTLRACSVFARRARYVLSTKKLDKIFFSFKANLGIGHVQVNICEIPAETSQLMAEL